jgi:hypothetical protein
LAEAAAVLESRLQNQIDSSKKERFFWIFAVTILSDPLVYKLFDGSVWFIIPIILQVVFLIGMADHLGVERVAVPLQLLFDRLLSRLGKKSQ